MRRFIIALAWLFVPGSGLRAGDWHIPHPHATSVPAGKPRSIPHTHERAGWPLAISGHAKPTRSSNVVGYRVGGGAIATHGEPPTRQEGTWGFDDTGLPWHRRRVALNWWHGRHAQGGRGAYETDGHAPPDVIAGASRWLQRHHD